LDKPTHEDDASFVPNVKFPRSSSHHDSCTENASRIDVFVGDSRPFLSDGGKSRAIPVFVFYTDDLHYITHFTERSKSAHAELAAIIDQVKSHLNLPPNVSLSTLPEADRQAFLKELIPRIQPHSNQWRRDAIKEMRQLLSSALSVHDPATN